MPQDLRQLPQQRVGSFFIRVRVTPVTPPPSLPSLPLPPPSGNRNHEDPDFPESGLPGMDIRISLLVRNSLEILISWEIRISWEICISWETRGSGCALLPPAPLQRVTRVTPVFFLLCSKGAALISRIPQASLNDLQPPAGHLYRHL